MTESEILALPAGEPLDGLIAEKVFDWRWYGGKAWAHDKGEYWAARFLVRPGCEEEWMLAEFPPGLPVKKRFAVPKYSTDIAAAWQVAEWLRERWGLFQLTSAGQNWTCGHVTITLNKWGSGSTPMLAVCKAALLVVFARKEG